ncbi:hypothetical protein V6N11_039042 [Hibiscus sabdariffa]|uniref:DNL-type domain-containing protein n=1 Tax=Hibiscus sabdariffa TaxID=183260 RepID=A0ABR2SME8_9ROSI
MEALSSQATAIVSSSSPFSIFSPKRKHSTARIIRFPTPSKKQVSTFPWSLFTKSPRRRMRVAFTCNVCGQRTTRAINPHACTDGTVFVQCCGCNVFHKLVDNLNLFHEMKCYVNPSFNYKRDLQWDVGFKMFDEEDDADGGGGANVF